MTDKIVLSAGDLQRDSIALAQRIWRDGFRPTKLAAIWRGGAPVGMVVQEVLARLGAHSDHIAIRTSAYTDVATQAANVDVFGLEYLIDTVTPEDKLLLVDDVFDSGRTFVAVLAELKAKARANAPRDIRLAAPWYKPEKNTSGITPHYWVHETNQWLVFPHELDALEPEELAEHRPELHALLTQHGALEKG